VRSAVSTIAAAIATIPVSVCAAVGFTGTTTHHAQPRVHKISPDDIAHRGPYIGARHTGSLGKANSTIFFKPNAATANGVLALHVVESQMVLTQRIQAAKAQAASNPEVAAKLAVQAAAPAPAPVFKPNKSGIFA